MKYIAVVTALIALALIAFVKTEERINTANFTVKSGYSFFSLFVATKYRNETEIWLRSHNVPTKSDNWITTTYTSIWGSARTAYAIPYESNIMRAIERHKSEGRQEALDDIKIMLNEKPQKALAVAEKYQ